ncbi:NADP-dependent 3-hydroxy acid dehydrogenase YdfG [Lentzea xinjiangensis]|uniref:NADP-dependent 3-hydroxy acid dehydrogenase YdfG n=1 Tax=Lentzea xinjiangensis TaxID=402600 RepID=A0A1H9VVV9_9PSEU|nr:SDR family oxidoreductase [Lentzea xinjiangensis]SES25659.1 NADP-dependent 3-hydroxy acid dehydrogenase YdfG [Lentzea xinjiangensis]
MRDWTGSVAFITGGAQGIGLGIARALAKRGVTLVLADVDEAALARSAEELAREVVVRTYGLDVRDRDAFAKAAEEVESELGPVDLLFNNAGIVPYAAARELSYDKWDLALGVNLNGVINGVQTFLPRMLERRAGYIVNTASGAGLVPDAGVLYVTTKFAVVGLSESLRQAVAGHGVDVSVLCPGPVDTGIVGNTRSWGEDVAVPAGLVPAVEAFLRGGPGIDDVGEVVLAGMRARRPWIFTGDEIRPLLEERMAALLAAL